jgi:hypothetical protein
MATPPTSPGLDELRPELRAIATKLADRIWGPQGPAWGTRLSELEKLAVAVREVISERLLAEACQRQADQPRPPELQNCPVCDRPMKPREPEPRFVHTLGGEVEWQEPQDECTRCRRAFFPSVGEFGD